MSVPVLAMPSPEDRIRHHLRGLEAAFGEYYPGAPVEATFNEVPPDMVTYGVWPCGLRNRPRRPRQGLISVKSPGPLCCVARATKIEMARAGVAPCRCTAVQLARAAFFPLGGAR
jgi:hypothetical protein